MFVEENQFDAPWWDFFPLINKNTILMREWRKSWKRQNSPLKFANPPFSFNPPSFLKIQKILPEWKNLKMTTLLPLKSAPFNFRIGVSDSWPTRNAIWTQIVFTQDLCLMPYHFHRCSEHWEIAQSRKLLPLKLNFALKNLKTVDTREKDWSSWNRKQPTE